MKVGFGFSALDDSYSAGLQAFKDAVSMSGDPSLIVLFSTFNYNPYEVFRSIKENIKDSKLIGGTNRYIIVYDELVSKGISILTLSGKDIKVKTFAQEKSSKSDVEIGERTGKFFLENNFDSGVVITFFAHGLIDVSKMLSGLYNTMGPGFKYIGGGCDPNPESSSIYTFTERGVNTGPLVSAVVGGIEFSTAVGHGFDSIKDPLVINKTFRNKILEIDGIPAIDAYIRRFNVIPNKDLLIQIILHPLGFPNLSGDYLIRDPIGIDKKSILFPVEIPEGAVGYVMEGRIDKLVENTSLITAKALNSITDPGFVLVFDCISRESLMGDKFLLELKAIRDTIRLDIPITGMLSVGEIGCYSDSPIYHNKTTVIAVGGRKRDYEKEFILEKTDVDILSAELSMLHEIASLSSLVSEKDLINGSIEKSVRLFGVRRSAFIKKGKRGYKLLSSWGFRDVREVLESIDEDAPNKAVFPLGKGEKYGVLYLEMSRMIDERERRIFRIFAKRLEEIFDTIETYKKRKKIERSLRELALTDDLTKLYNRRGFLLLGEQYLKLSERLKRKAILIFMDVDNLKWINDNLGHNEGDKALIEIASILRKTSRKSDILARIGGDEFVLLGLETGNNNYNALLERIKEKIKSRNKRGHLLYSFSISMGVAVYDPDNPSSLKSLLEEADRKMYEEKRKKKE
ncbi:MAG: GGDEF domain-containing protein [bacterium]|nr:GGDEF domain-containing protein [bacterium]